MFSNFFCFLIISFVSLKFAEPTKRMLSIFGDIDFIHYDNNLAESDVLGFAYDDANNGFSVATGCTATNDGTYLSVDANCKITLKTASITVSTTTGVGAQLTGFPASGNNVNMMVAQRAVTPIVTKKTTELTASTAITTITTSGAESVTSFQLFCNEHNETKSEKLFAVTLATASSNAASVTSPTVTNNTLYESINKCFVQAYKDTTAAFGLATFIFIVTDADQRPVVFIPTTLTDYAVINQNLIKDSAIIGSAIGTISGETSCPANDNFTFPSSTTSNPCSGSITTKTKLDGCASPLLWFEYGSKNYTILVQHVDSDNVVVQCIAHYFKFSNILIGFLSVYLLKTLKFF